MITFMETTEEAEKCIDPRLWHACAGGMVQIPAVDSKVLYFPQGHAEHASEPVDFRNCPMLPPFVACRVLGVKFMADIETDEVYSKIKLVPLTESELHSEEDRVCGLHAAEVQDKPASFAKTLTQSDANNGGGFSVPRFCADTIFPRLDYNVEPPVQNLLAKDVHGEVWKFRHIFRGTPRRHLLTTGWSVFVNKKKLVAGDSIVFLRAANGDLCVGIRRARRGIGVGPESMSRWNPMGENGGYSGYWREEEGTLIKKTNGLSSDESSLSGNGKVTSKSIIEAAKLAAEGQPFEVIYYPRASTPEFFVKASSVMAAMQIPWCSGMRFKMAFETEDSSRISWFMGTISSVQVADPDRWPESPWRLLQVVWDEPDLLLAVKRVSPWRVELVSTMSPINLSSLPPPMKKQRLPPHLEIPIDATQFAVPTPFSANNLSGPGLPHGCLPYKTSPAGMQGARHALYNQSFLDHRLHSFQCPYRHPSLEDTSTFPTSTMIQKPSMMTAEVAGLLTMGCLNDSKPRQFVLFGQTILTEQQLSQSSGESVSLGIAGNSSSDGNEDKVGNVYDESIPTHFNLEMGHCEVFMESEDVGRTIDLSLLGSYDELRTKLAGLIGIENSDLFNSVVYVDGSGTVKHIGGEPFSEFVKSAKRVTISMDSSSAVAGG